MPSRGVLLEPLCPGGPLPTSLGGLDSGTGEDLPRLWSGVPSDKEFRAQLLVGLPPEGLPSAEEGVMNDRDHELVLSIINTAVNALSQQDDDQKVVEAFLDSISVQEATLLYREAMRRHGQTGDAS
jgi:hypothetical protein